MKCEKCNSLLIEYKNGDVTEYICPICDGTPVTQSENMIEFDTDKYVVRILTTKTYDISLLKAVARACYCNALGAKKILEDTGYVFAPMDAFDTRSIRDKLQEGGIPFTITPEFPW